MKFLIWKSSTLEENLAAFNKLNNFQELQLTPLLQQWALRFGLRYPNNMGTEKWAEPLICSNPRSIYYNAVAMPILDAVYQSLNSDLIGELQQLGISLPDEGITQVIEELPEDWNTLFATP